MHAVAETVAVTCDASGDFTGYTEVVTGRVLTAIFTDTDLDAGADFTITAEDTGQNIWTESNTGASKTIAPRQATHSTAGVASLYAAGGEPVEDYIVVVNERIKVVVAQGGNGTTGSFTFIIG